MAAYIPSGWPPEVQLPGSEDFELSAVGWLQDVLPTDCRAYPVLSRYPAALAFMARHYSLSSLEGARRGYRAARCELGEAVPPHAVDAVLGAYRKEGFRLRDTARAVASVERALRDGTPAWEGREGPR